MNCLRCGSPNSVTNGPTNSGNQNFKCRDCHRYLVQNPRHQPILEGTKELIDRL
ncbi:IS1/IS1595 family N-terminal zinc-binding domain-containing protein [Microcoleus sp. herbarium2]|uniref:IS1/IS1595 family N-terminal zinc-binding domain-containing protein n=1 Tax=Microcoleus sp. herbarium2 TaxID=3055433 RepID=UPI0040408266